MDSKNLLENTRKGFESINIDQKYKDAALKNIEEWLTKDIFTSYFPQIEHLIKNEDWDYLLDCFYQVIPFGTGGRRGEVGIGPNRINAWTIQASAQGHSQYLKNIYGDKISSRGVVLAFGVREFFGNKHFNNSLSNPTMNLTGEGLARAAAQVYLANDVKVYLFDAPRTTPELSFAIRYLKALAGDMFDASHNPPEHNGKKVYDETGGQLIPPHDEELVNEVTKKVTEIKTIDFEEIEKDKLFQKIGKEVDDAFVTQINNLSLSKARGIKIVYTPLHGVGSMSIYKVLKAAGFDITEDPNTKNQSGKFENVTFNIPNPEVIQSFDTTLKFAKKQDAELILNSDPDADRIGIMVKTKEIWKYLNGNEIGSMLTRYVIDKKKGKLKGKGVVIKTTVTTNLATKICEDNDTEIVGDLPVGFKYIGDEMNKLEKEGRIDDFLLGLEESHGYIAGNYLRDKDAAIGALWLSELASELKDSGKTLLDYLNETYSKYGYYRNYLTEIRLPGAEGMTQIRKIQDTMRKEHPESLGNYNVEKVEDLWDRKPIVSETDKVSKDVLIFHLMPFSDVVTAKVTLRPSGTEPKAKMYFEIGTKPVSLDKLEDVKTKTEEILKDLEKKFMLHCYKILGIDFPERGFLLFWQIPMKDKLKYFEIEPEIEKLKELESKEEKIKKLNNLLEFLGSDPIQKVDAAFKEKFGKGINEYLQL